MAIANRKFQVVIPVVAGIGNALLTVPLVRRVKQAFPGCAITIIARTNAMAEPFRRLSEVDEVLVTGKDAKGVFKGIAWTRKRRADLYLVPFPSNRWQYSLLAWVSGARRRLQHSYPVAYWRTLQFLNERIPAQRGIHDVEQNLNLLKPLGVPDAPPEAPIFPVTDTDRARAVGLLQQAGFSSDVKPIILHAGSGPSVLQRAKRWPPASYAELIRRLEEDLNLPVALVEGPDEAGVAQQIAPNGKIIRLLGPLGEAAAILERAQLYVGSDSGLAHLASAVGTAAVTLFAPADPDRVCPFGYRDLVVQAPTSCAPCIRYPWHSPYPKICCQEPMCITQISVEAVLAKVRQALGSPALVQVKR